MKVVGALVAVGAALAFQTTLARFAVGGTAAIDLVLVAVIYVALTTGPVRGLLVGSMAGLVQDTLSTGVIGIGGLSKAVVGFLVGAFAQQFIVTAALPRVVMFIAATAVHLLLFMGLYAALGVKSFSQPWTAVAGQALGNALAGLVVFAVVESLPGVAERWRGRRVRRR